MNIFGHNKDNLREFDAVKPGLPKTMLYYFKQLNYFFKNTKAFLRDLKLKVVRNKNRRSERREACYLVLGQLLNNIDLKTFNQRRGAGVATYCRFTVETIADALKLSWSRVQRALDDLRNSGYIESEQHYHARGKSSSRFVLLKKLFQHLNIKESDINKSSWYAETSQTMKSRYSKTPNPKPAKSITLDRGGFVVAKPHPPSKAPQSIKSLLKAM